MPAFNISVREQNGVVIIDTDGYLNNVGGEIIASECYSQVDKGKKDFILADRLIHHSVAQALMQCPAKFKRYDHLDLDSLEFLLEKIYGNYAYLL